MAPHEGVSVRHQGTGKRPGASLNVLNRLAVLEYTKTEEHLGLNWRSQVLLVSKYKGRTPVKMTSGKRERYGRMKQNVWDKLQELLRKIRTAAASRSVMLGYLSYNLIVKWASQVTLVVENLSANMGRCKETWVWSLGWENPLEKGTATHSSVLAWRIPMDRGAWLAIAHEVAKSWTRLKRLSMHTHTGVEWSFALC